MPTVTKHTPGTLCWADLSTKSPDGRRFYTALFGWTVNELPLGPNQTYAMMQLGGRDVCALSEEREPTMPSMWTNYIAVDDVDAALKQAESLGGTVQVPATDVFDSGRMAVIGDPTGASIAVWQARKHIGAGVFGEPGALCWVELMTTDTGRCERFYTALFGWTAETSDMPTGRYTVFRKDDKYAAGMMAITGEMGPMPPSWTTYFAVASAADAVERAEKLGARVHVRPTPIPGTGTFAALADPQGAAFSILQPEM